MGQGKRHRGAGQRTRGGKRAGSGTTRRGSSKWGVSARGLHIEPLEDRRMLATFTVTNLLDVDGGGAAIAGSLRAAVNAANGGNANEQDVILFADGLTGTVLLNGGQLNITQQMRILGPGPLKVGVQAGANSRIFDINVGADDEYFGVEISGLTLTGGRATTGDVDDRLGGGIWNREDLQMTEVIMANNLAQRGGGAIFHQFGSLTVSRSFFGAWSQLTFGFGSGNSAGGIGGGAILVGDDSDEMENLPSATVINSTFSGNSSSADGGALFNRKGTLVVRNSTIVNNIARLGGGIASQGNPLDEEAVANPQPDPLPVSPAPTIFTYVVSSILYGNENTGVDPLRMEPGGDLNEVGSAQSDEAGPFVLEPSVVSYGLNYIGATSIEVFRTVPPDPMDPFSIFGLDATDTLDTDPLLVGDFLFPGQPGYYGGSTPVFLPDDGSPVIDAGGYGPFGPTQYEQRGRHFVREYDAAPDVGASEKQLGLFIVDLIADESDNQFSTVSEALDPYSFGDFSLREALLFADANPGVDTINFVDFRGDILNPDPTISPVPTILLAALGSLVVQSSVIIEGPSDYILEIDASGADPTPLVNNSDGSRVFEITDGSNGSLLDVAISNLTIMGGDYNASGGGIFSRENLTLSGVTLKDNNTAARGGGVYLQYGTLTITDSTFNGNRAADDGGGLYIDAVGTGQNVSIENSTFSGNVAGDRGAGITNNAGVLTVRYSTITANSSGSAFGSGIVNFNAAASTTLYSTIVSGNLARDIEAFSGATINTFTSEGYNFVGNGNASAKFIETGDVTGNTNPMLAPLANTGGLVATHRPLPNSPVIDAGPMNPTNPPAFDQRGEGFVRVFDGNLDMVDRIDIGSYELQATTLVVDSPGDASDGNFSTGNFSLREAIEISNQNPLHDTIRFAPGLSTILVGGLTTTTLLITDSVDIIGNGSQDLVIQAGQVVPAQIALADRIFTIDNGQASLINVSISGLEIRNAQVGAILSRENLTLDDIVFINNQNMTSGGALIHETGSLKLLNSFVTGNSTNTVGADGGAMYLRNVNGAAKIEFEYSTFSGNFTSQSLAEGGGLFIKNSVAEFRGVTISGNSTLAGTADGGAIYVDGSTILFEESTISGNATVGANSEGGGLFINGATSVVTLAKSTGLNFNSTAGSQAAGGGAYVAAGTLNIENSAVLLNSTTGLGAAGGGIAVGGGTLNVIGSSVLQNRVSGLNSNGGGIANLSANVVIRDSTIASNRAIGASTNGGAVYSDTNLLGTQSTKIINSTISGNSAPWRGGGVFNADGSLEIRHSTITNNSTPYLNTGNGVASLGNAATQTIVESSIIAGNVGADTGTGSDVDYVDAQFLNSFTSAGYNVIGTGNALSKFNQPGDKIGITNPLLGPLAANGGLVDTHAVLDGSAAINAGKPSFNANSFSPPLTTDARGVGFPRVLGGRIDAGAFETPFTPFTADFDLDGDVDGGDFLVWQRFNGLMAGGTKNKGDANGDGKVDGTDLAIWRTQVGAGGESSAAVAAAGSVAPATAASVVAALDDNSAEPVEIAPSAGATLAPVNRAAHAVETTVSDASQSTSNLAWVVSTGASAARRPAFRPATTRVFAHDAVHASLELQISRRSGSAASEEVESHFDGHTSADERDGDLDAEDSVFAMLGEGAL